MQDVADRICFAPTTLQKADCLTKTSVTREQREMIFHNNFEQRPISDDTDEDSDNTASVFLVLRPMDL